MSSAAEVELAVPNRDMVEVKEAEPDSDAPAATTATDYSHSVDINTAPTTTASPDSGLTTNYEAVIKPDPIRAASSKSLVANSGAYKKLMERQRELWPDLPALLIDYSNLTYTRAHRTQGQAHPHRVAVHSRCSDGSQLPTATAAGRAQLADGPSTAG